MGLFRDLRKYFNWKSKIPTVPMQYIAPYKSSEIKGDAMLLMEAGIARSPQQAHRLMNKRGQSAREILDNLPVKKINRKERLLRLIMRLQNAKPAQYIKAPKTRRDSRLHVRAHYRESKS